MAKHRQCDNPRMLDKRASVAKKIIFYSNNEDFSRQIIRFIVQIIAAMSAQRFSVSLDSNTSQQGRVVSDITHAILQEADVVIRWFWLLRFGTGTHGQNS